MRRYLFAGMGLLFVTFEACPREELRILVSGGSGLIGTALLTSLEASGHAVTRLVRGLPTAAEQIVWDPQQPLSPDSVSGFDAVVHLAGESIAGRWTSGRKRRILESREQGTRHLAEALARAHAKPRTLLSSSAIGVYGDRKNEVVDETSSGGKGFLAEVCRRWEASTEPAAQAGIRTAQLRTGLVLSRDGGALQKMLLPFRLGLGGRTGSGRQWWSWIHLQDLIGAIHHILQDSSLAGPVNGVAPNPVTNAEFARTLAAVISRPAFFPMPALAVRLLFGEMGQELLLSGQRVQPTKLTASGYRFQYPDLRRALQEILPR